MTELFSNEETGDLVSQEESQPEIFETTKTDQNNNEFSKETEETTLKEQEMFQDLDSEEDFEIPAFLRRQKN